MEQIHHASEKSVIVADDDVISRRLLERFLSKWGYHVISCEDGKEAKEAFEGDHKPRLALLDWSMPEFDGLELCKMWKRGEGARFCYIIMITGKTELEEAITAFAAGADDLITKPIDKRFLESRIRVATRIIDYEMELQVERNFHAMHATQMEELAQQRAKQLVHADRLVTLGTMSAGIAHEINNPTSFISGNVQTLQKFWPEILDTIDYSLAQGNGDQSKLNFIKEEVPQLLDGMKTGVSRISAIVKGLKRYSRQGHGAGDKEPTNVVELIEHTLHMTEGKLKGRVSVETDLSDSLPLVKMNPVEIEQVLVNLIVNAADAMEGQESAPLKVGARVADETVVLTIEDGGPGIPEDLLSRIWTPFFTTKDVDKGTGLGLHICRDIIEAHEGDIRVENKPGGGAVFTIELPQ